MIPVSGADAVGAVWKRSGKSINSNMKKLTFLTVAIAMVASLSLSAADDAKPKRGGKAAAENLKKYDANGDGKLDKEERAKMKAEKKKDAAPEPAK